MLELKNISFDYDDVEVINNMSFKVDKNEVVALVGPSGCGKSTLLRVIAGLEKAKNGNITLDGVDITKTHPSVRNIGMLFQNYSLFPHMSVEQNILYANKHADVNHLLNLIEMPGYNHRFAHELSGGQQQRVALVRAIAANPKVLLLDEPFSNYDSELKVHIRNEIKAILNQHDISVIIVTHDLEDAYALDAKIIEI
jgi:iron(III) transport system ATP-binding protein